MYCVGELPCITEVQQKCKCQVPRVRGALVYEGLYVSPKAAWKMLRTNFWTVFAWFFSQFWMDWSCTLKWCMKSLDPLRFGWDIKQRLFQLFSISRVLGPNSITSRKFSPKISRTFSRTPHVKVLHLKSDLFGAVHAVVLITNVSWNFWGKFSGSD